MAVPCRTRCGDAASGCQRESRRRRRAARRDHRPADRGERRRSNASSQGRRGRETDSRGNRAVAGATQTRRSPRFHTGSGRSSLRSSLTALDVEDDSLEAVRIRLQILDDRVGDRLILISTKARRHQDDARVPCIRRDGVASEPEEVDDVPGDDRPAFARGVLQLCALLISNPGIGASWDDGRGFLYGVRSASGIAS